MQYFNNKFLIAMPCFKNPFFYQSVVLICQHNKQGAMGLIINQPSIMNIFELLEQENIHLKLNKTQVTKKVFTGGPVNPQKGFVIHTGDNKTWHKSLEINQDLQVTTSVDILENLFSKNSPKKFIVALGYCVWEQGDLEQEMADNFWLTSDVDNDFIFNQNPNNAWEQAANLVGVNIWDIQATPGHA